MRHVARAVAGLVVTGSVIMTGCSGVNNASTDPTTGAPKSTGSSAPRTSDVSVEIADFAFTPDTISVAAGATVRWTNEDKYVHTVTGDDVAELDSRNLSPGATYSHTFTVKGTYRYKCSIHSTMTAQILVE